MKRLLHLTTNISTKGILYETGIWPLKEKILYKKLMLLHNIIHFDNEIIIKKIVQEQDTSDMEGSWLKNLKTESLENNIVIDCQAIIKSSKEKYKTKVKETIQQKI